MSLNAAWIPPAFLPLTRTIPSTASPSEVSMRPKVLQAGPSGAEYLSWMFAWCRVVLAQLGKDVLRLLAV